MLEQLPKGLISMGKCVSSFSMLIATEQYNEVFDSVGAHWRIGCCGTRFGARKKAVDMVGRAGEGFVRCVRAGSAVHVGCLGGIMISTARVPCKASTS